MLFYGVLVGCIGSKNRADSSRTLLFFTLKVCVILAVPRLIVQMIVYGRVPPLQPL